MKRETIAYARFSDGDGIFLVLESGTIKKDGCFINGKPTESTYRLLISHGNDLQTLKEYVHIEGEEASSPSNPLKDFDNYCQKVTYHNYQKTGKNYTYKIIPSESQEGRKAYKEYYKTEREKTLKEIEALKRKLEELKEASALGYIEG